MRALVTGGAGFIGSHLVDALLARGHSVSVVDDLSLGRPERIPAAVALHVEDIADAPAMQRVLGEERPEVVFHLAAQADVRRSVADPAHDARLNVVGTASVLEAARAAGARRLLLASTGGALYGDTNAIPTPESTPLAPFSPYGTSKAAGELYCGLYTRLHGLSTLALRFGNVYGPRQDPHGEAGVIAIFAGAAAEGRSVTVYGDGAQTRDYVYVGDVVSACLAAAGADATGAVNIGVGVETSVLELVRALGVEAALAPARTGEVARSCLDVTRAAEVLGWRAEVGLEEGLERTVAAVQAA
jgi:UDP-glucose 4-epimerase